MRQELTVFHIFFYFIILGSQSVTLGIWIRMESDTGLTAPDTWSPKPGINTRVTGTVRVRTGLWLRVGESASRNSRKSQLYKDRKNVLKYMCMPNRTI